MCAGLSKRPGQLPDAILNARRAWGSFIPTNILTYKHLSFLPCKMG